MKPLDIDNALWRFSLKVYAAPGVERECLTLQAEYDLDVNLLLLGAWLGATRCLKLESTSVAEAREVVAAWQNDVVKPLRAARKAAKASGCATDAAVGSLRADLAHAEIKAEQVEQALLFDWAEGARLEQPHRAARDMVLSNLALVVRSFGGRIPDPVAPALLSAAIDQVSAGPR